MLTISSQTKKLVKERKALSVIVVFRGDSEIIVIVHLRQFYKFYILFLFRFNFIYN